MGVVFLPITAEAVLDFSPKQGFVLFFFLLIFFFFSFFLETKVPAVQYYCHVLVKLDFF